MRATALLATIVTASIATAEPPADSPFKPHLEAAVRAGYGWSNTNGSVGPTPGGDGPFVDGELMWRWRTVSVGVFGACFTEHLHTYANDQSEATTADARYDFFDVGGRVNLHPRGDLWGPLLGLGIAYAPVYESGTESVCYCANNFCNPCNPGPSNQRFWQWTKLPSVELHAGVTLPRMGDVSLEVLAVLTYGFNPDDTEHLLTTKRVAIGGRF